MPVAQAQSGARSPARCDVRDFLTDVSVLAADSMEGRRAGTSGAMRAATYIARRFHDAGLTTPAGGWLQRVPLVSRQNSLGRLAIAGTTTRLSSADSGVTIQTERDDARTNGSGDAVFVGYGVHAPEVGWDDFAGVDVRDRIVVLRSGGADSAHRRLGWDRDDIRATDAYKLTVARTRGARGAIVLMSGHAPPDARGTLSLPNGRGSLALVAWLGARASHALATALGITLDSSRAMASNPVPRPRHASRIAFEVRQQITPVEAANVVGILPARPDTASAVLFLAHYDHLGIRPTSAGADSIYNGALDNASGVSAIICLARQFTAMRDTLRRTLVFLATTAEEHQGHLGAAWYVEHPAVSLARTAVALNVDGVNTVFPTDDFLALPGSLIDTEGALEAAGRATGMTGSVASFERGMDWSFDTDVFNRRGVPALTIWQGFKARGIAPQEFVRLSRARNASYHTPSDTLSADWNAEAIEQHLRLLYRVGFELASATRRATLRAPSPFSLWPDASSRRDR